MIVKLLRILPLVSVPLATVLATPLEIDPKTGQYRDLSYAALTEEGLSAEERTRLFGGETIHYGELTDGERLTAQGELEGLLEMINGELVGNCRTNLHRWLMQQAADLPAACPACPQGLPPRPGLTAPPLLSQAPHLWPVRARC